VINVIKVVREVTSRPQGSQDLVDGFRPSGRRHQEEAEAIKAKFTG
jgi:hypothetical protein